MKNITEILETKKDSILELEKFLYNNPEIEMEEFKAKEKLITLLQRENFTVESDIAGLPTAFVAHKSSGAGPSIGIMAEYDALPGMGHACGHNLIGAMGFGTAVVLAEMLEELKGSVYLFGSPAEETGRGKPGLLREGWLKKADVAMMVHPMKFSALTSNMVNLEGYDITFHGRASHAAGSPENGVNALDAAVIFYNSVGLLRQQTLDGSRVHMIITNGGAAVNIIPDTAALRVEIRHENLNYFRGLVDKVLSIAHAAAQAAGCTVDIEMFEPPIACMKNNGVMIELFKKHLHEVGITEYVEEFSTGGCTDMGNVSQEVPSIHPFMKMVRPDSDEHTLEFLKDVDEPYAIEQMYKIIECMARVGADILKEPRLLQEIKNDFAKA
ncbi:amidohydrolase [uncultured Cloacibacillus sp.]|uniref:M20 family metallopeptidase n=1 Tax=uncultured Cloacibacillus sp. TaxID=889794 RepID=UPI0027D93BC6|nr:amidohydrolase [uncultured Cloacibacillus sp.]